MSVSALEDLVGIRTVDRTRVGPIFDAGFGDVAERVDAVLAENTEGSGVSVRVHFVLARHGDCDLAAVAVGSGCHLDGGNVGRCLAFVVAEG